MALRRVDLSRLKENVNWNAVELEARERDLKRKEDLLKVTTREIADLTHKVESVKRALADATRNLERAEQENKRAEQEAARK